MGDFDSRRTARAGRRTALAAMLVAGALVAGGAVGGASASSSTLTIGVIAPFTGTQAALGAVIFAPCTAATRVINAAGGVLGHPLQCQSIDDYGDAADAVPNVSKALATNGSLVGVLGVDSDVAATVVPILNNAKLPLVSSNGLAAFDKSTYPYFWRDTAPDLAGGAAMGLWAAQRGYKRVALITQNDVGDTGNLPGALKAFAYSHVKVTANLTIAGDAPSYQSLVTRVKAGKPQALMISTDEPTLGTLLSEYKTLNGGSVPPLVTDTGIFDASAFSTIKGSTSLNYLLNSSSFVGSYVNQGTPEFAAYRNAVNAASKAKLPAVVVATGAVASLFDGGNIEALAMVMAHSTVGAKYNKDIALVSTKRAGAVVVHTFAQGVKQLKSGHQIQYIGVTGPITFDKYHNSPGEFAAFAFTAGKGTRTLGRINQSIVAQLTR